MTEFENEFTWGKAVSTNSTQEFHEKFEKALDEAKKELGQKHPIIINSQEIYSDNNFSVYSPSDTRIKIADFPKSTISNTKNAISGAKNAFDEWSNFSFQKRIEIFRECADYFSSKKFFLSAIMTFENGKNRFEAMGDVDEAIDFMRFYAYQMEKNDGFCKHTSHPNPNEKTQAIMKPYGVWGIISPFNFPSAIAIGMTTGALITGNTAVLKPASDTPLSSFYFVKHLFSKIPGGTLNFVTGSGSVVGKTLIESDDVDGIAFTGSREVGMQGFQEFTKTTTKPFISEMGGKNPVIVTKNADLDKAVNGVMNAAFGYGGQKCSACSRVYIQNEIAEKFIEKLVEKTKKNQSWYALGKRYFSWPNN